MRRRHLGLLEDLLPTFRFEPADIDPARQRWLEIGFGGGEHLAHQAALNPAIEMIGAEAFINGVAKLMSLVDEKALKNIRVHFGDAREAMARMPDACLDRVYLLYPDPWPKARHNKRRFVNEASLKDIRRLLKPGGTFVFASDIEDYVSWTLAAVAESGHFTETGNRAQPPENWTETRYEAKARREGRGSAYLTFVTAG